MLQSTETLSNRSTVSLDSAVPTAEPRQVVPGLDGDYGDDGTQLLEQVLRLWRQP